MLKSTSRSFLATGVGRITLRWKTKKSDDVRMVRMLQKMYLKQNNAKKRFKPQFDFLPRKESVANDEMPECRKRVVSNGQQKRACQVSKVLYDYLVQIVNTGELDPYLAANNVEITGVKLEPDFTNMNVYWSATGTQQDKEIEEVLRKNQGKLRHVLTSYHLVSFIPCITFVKDKSSTNVKRVEEILKTIDFGPDFIPSTVPLDIVRHQYNITPPQSVQDKLEKVQMFFHEKDLIGSQQDLVNEIDDKSCAINVTGSKNNIYGVQHEEIMKNLILKKSKERKRPVTNNPNLTDMYKISPDLSNSASKQYNQLALKFKKPKVEKAKILLRQMEQEYILENFKMVKKEDTLEMVQDVQDEDEDEEYVSEKFKNFLDEEEDSVDMSEKDIHNEK